MPSVKKLAITPDGDPKRTTHPRGLCDGRVRLFDVVDGNVGRNNRWRISVFVPDDADKRIWVEAATWPKRKMTARAADLSVTFSPVVLGRTRNALYGLVSLPSNSKGARKYVDAAQKAGLLRKARWFRTWLPKLKAKHKVIPASTGTRDSYTDKLVVVVKADAYEEMVQLFFAIKIWPLQHEVTVSQLNS